MQVSKKKTGADCTGAIINFTILDIGYVCPEIRNDFKCWIWRQVDLQGVIFAQELLIRQAGRGGGAS